MIIKNRTNQIQEISVVNRDNPSLTYSIYIRAKSELNLDDDIVILNLKNLIDAGVLSLDREIDKLSEVPLTKIPKESLQISSDNEVVEEYTEVDETLENPELTSEIPEGEILTDDKILCEICGKEFASKRSLTLHMKKSHQE